MRSTHGRFTLAAILLVLSVSIAGFSQDCDGDGTLDSVEIERGAPDCNQNGIPDRCDLAPSRILAHVQPVDLVNSLDHPRVADLDLDGRPDLYASSGYRSDLQVLWNEAGGDRPRFNRVSIDHDPPGSSLLVAGRFDRDQRLALVAQTVLGASLYVIRQGLPRRFLTPEVGFASEDDRAHDLLALDLNGDGYDDLVSLVERRDGTREIQFFETVVDAGGTSFSPRSVVEVSASASELTAGDFDGDGDSDLAVLSYFSRQSNLVQILFASTDPWLVDATFRTEGRFLSTADHNVDGVDELLSYGFPTPRVQLSEVTPDGVNVVASIDTGAFVRTASIADFDGDGLPDLLLATAAGIETRLGDGHGEFQPDLRYRKPTFFAAWADFDLDGDLDAVAGTSLLLQGEQPPSRDCDANDVPDECESADAITTAVTLDCNENGIDDRCDVDAGTSTDRNSDGIPDECGAQPVFSLDVDAPEEVYGDLNGEVPFLASLRLRSFGLDPKEEGVLGWSFSIHPEGGKIVHASTRGTVAGVDGLQTNGFQMIGHSRDENCEGTIVGAVVLSFTDPVSLVPDEEGEIILHIDARASIGKNGGEMTFTFTDFCYGGVNGNFVDRPVGGGGSQPVDNIINFQGVTVEPVLFGATVTAVPHRFRRGDVNTDARVDISDPIRTFMFLFLGADPPNCLDAADANDDGAVDLSDGILVLLDFFRSDTAIPSPGPANCGPDGTPDRLNCDAYDVCP